MRVLITAATAVGITSAPALAGPPSESAAPSTIRVPPGPHGREGKFQPNFAAMTGAIDKLFPPQPEPDPTRLILARTAVQSLWPDGTYARMMSVFMGNIVNGAMQMRKWDIVPAGKANGATDNRTFREQAAAKDPYFDQRIAAYRAVIDEEVGKLSLLIDPRMREGLARTMARRFDARQLTDINAFFATPSGHALAGQYMQLWADPDTLRAMVDAMPEMIKLMPDVMGKFEAIDARYPKPKSPAPKPDKH